jgi:hypothetical protein
LSGALPLSLRWSVDVVILWSGSELRPRERASDHVVPQLGVEPYVASGRDDKVLVAFIIVQGVDAVLRTATYEHPEWLDRPEFRRQVETLVQQFLIAEVACSGANDHTAGAGG